MRGSLDLTRVFAALVMTTLILTLSACGADGELVKTMCSADNPECNYKFGQVGADDSSVDDRTDEEKPPFAKPPTSADTNPGAKPTTVSTPPPSGPSTGGGGFGVDGSLSCVDYVAQYWKVGAQTYEEAPGPIFTTLKYTTTVLALSGTNVTVRAQLVTPDSSQNLDEQMTFDACTHGHMAAVPKTNTPCNATFLADEVISVGGKSYNAKKYQIGECTLESGKTFSSIVWRAKDIPLWGALKREVRGTIVPSQLSGLISATTKSWLFP